MWDDQSGCNYFVGKSKSDLKNRRKVDFPNFKRKLFGCRFKNKHTLSCLCVYFNGVIYIIIVSLNQNYCGYNYTSSII